MSINETLGLFFMQRFVGISFDLERQNPHIGLEINESNSISPIPLLHLEQITILVS